jgi:acyl-CoA thioesterase I
MSFMPATGWRPLLCAGSYGARRAFVQIVALCSVPLAIATVTLPARAQAPAGQAPIHIVALGDSLTAGYGLADKDGFVPQLQAALAAKGADAALVNAGVSGDTTSDGVVRLDWSVPAGTDAVIVELGANDMLRGIKPDVTRQALDAIVARLTQRHIAVLLCGMRAAPNLGADYGQAFERIYPDLAAKYDVLLYPFFLDGVAGNLSLTQHDGLHPTAAGVAVIVGRIVPKVLQLVAQVRAQKPS